jgi:hypothetical protein
VLHAGKEKVVTRGTIVQRNPHHRRPKDSVVLKTVTLTVIDWKALIAAIRGVPGLAHILDKIEAEFNRPRPVWITNDTWRDWEAAAAAGAW